jgi:PAS domain S-box-containing protein
VDGQADQIAALVNSVRDYAIFLLDPTGCIVTWNAGAENLKGYTAQEAVGRHFSMFYTEEDRARRHPEHELEIAEREGSYEEEGWRVRQDGTQFWANVVITAVRDDDGGLAGFAKVTRDLTDRRAGEHALRRANEDLRTSNQELDRFASVAAHDLREPLHTIAGFTDLLRDEVGAGLEPRHQAYFDHVVSAVGRMTDLVDDLLEYARSGVLDTPAGVSVDIGRALDGVRAELAAAIERRGVRLAVEVAPGTLVRAEARDVSAALRNLLSNAVKFSDPESPQVTVRSAPVDGGWQVEVIDNGMGIDPAQRRKVFQAFQRLHSAADYPGTGLGLAIAQRVIERHGGAIGLDSSVGAGSRFWFTLPGA